ncbi:hypothetical protein Sta7437_3354 [Stanieria cyanosphaera PCC 7437]|uniref:Uncharacterized protein n=1 Tax=Stanieria cyanosphaera (strain ATCC 29371 / PCC 7437) TaxID=111780 RepID=K9XW92_STAC7|nr:hypothetical protein [Stanieria cyanosphaera]AFZ36860.1 hypothetical protein Sta7437_3354 [Stanieria cyanosphaera PCC 7437]
MFQDLLFFNGVVTTMFTKQSLFLIPVLIIVSAGVASANNIEVKNGHTQVSIGNNGINIRNNPSPSLIDRLINWRGTRSTSTSSQSQVSSSSKCSQSSSTYSSNRSTGGGVIRSSSSATTTTCR